MSPPRDPRTCAAPLGYNPPSLRVLVWDTAADLGLTDMDGDGCPDLVVAGGSAHQVGVWRWDPVFGGALSPVLVETGGSADRVAVGDVNGDGRADLVTMDESTGQATILLQTSSSPLAFGPSAVAPPPLGACHGLVLADVDRDGALDLVTNDPAGDRVLFLYGGKGGFAFRESPTKASTGRAMAVADVDGDGWLDVVVVDEGGRSVTCLRQQPTAPRVFDDVHSALGIAIDESGVHVCGLAIGDPGVNGNLTTVDTGLARLGRPAVNTALNHARTIGEAGIGLADMDRDGRLDLVCAPLPTDPDASPVVVFGSTSTGGAFGPTAQRRKGNVKPPVGGGVGALCIGDLDGDGHLDVVMADPDAGTLALHYFENGDIPDANDFRQTTSLDGTFHTRAMAAADLDRDGLPDLVSATTAGLEVRFQDAASPGSYGPPTTLLVGIDCRCVAVGDVNGDGCPDLVVGAGANGAAILRDPAAARGFLSPITFPAPQGGIGALRSLALADFDRDGHLDMVCVRESPTLPKLGVARGLANGFFDVFTEVSLSITSPEAVAAADLDGDGRLDLAVAGDGLDGSCVVLQDAVVPLKWMAPESLQLQRGVRVATGDVDGDGRADVVTSGDEGVAVALQSVDLPGRFLPAYALDTEACGGLALGDVDRDGRLDACFVEVKTGTLVCITGDPDFDLLRVISLNGLPPGVPFDATIVLEADTDGDGQLEPVTCVPTAPGAATTPDRRLGQHARGALIGRLPSEPRRLVGVPDGSWKDRGPMNERSSPGLPRAVGRKRIGFVLTVLGAFWTVVGYLHRPVPERQGLGRRRRVQRRHGGRPAARPRSLPLVLGPGDRGAERPGGASGGAGVRRDADAVVRSRDDARDLDRRGAGGDPRRGRRRPAAGPHRLGAGRLPRVDRRAPVGVARRRLHALRRTFLGRPPLRRDRRVRVLRRARDPGDAIVAGGAPPGSLTHAGSDHGGGRGMRGDSPASAGPTGIEGVVRGPGLGASHRPVPSAHVRERRAPIGVRRRGTLASALAPAAPAQP